MSYDKNARPERKLVFVEFRLANDAGKAGALFYDKYFKAEVVVGFSTALFDFVKYGVLDKDALIAEIGPEEAKLDTAGRLCHDYWGPWRFNNDEEIRAYGRKVYDYLKNDGQAKPSVLIRLYGAAVLAYRQIDEEAPSDVDKVVKQRLEQAYQSRNFDGASDGPFQINSKEEEEVLSPILQFSSDAFEKSKLTHAKSDLLSALSLGSLREFAAMPVSSHPWILKLFAEKDVLQTADNLFYKNPYFHEVYFRHAFERGIAAKDWELLRVLIAQLEGTVARTKQFGSKNRLNVLIAAVKSQIPPEELAKS